MSEVFKFVISNMILSVIKKPTLHNLSVLTIQVISRELDGMLPLIMTLLEWKAFDVRKLEQGQLINEQCYICPNIMVIWLKALCLGFVLQETTLFQSSCGWEIFRKCLVSMFEQHLESYSDYRLGHGNANHMVSGSCCSFLLSSQFFG